MLPLSLEGASQWILRMASLIITYEITHENISHEARQTIPKWGCGVDSPVDSTRLIPENSELN